MKLPVIIFAMFLAFLSLDSKAQSSPVPENYELKAKDDYAKYEPDVIKTIDWLQQTPWSEEPERKKANAFFIAWITGSPDVSISVGSPLLKFTDKNGELLIAFMGGYTKYAIEHKTDFNKDQANAAALRALMSKYVNEPTHIEDSDVEKLIKIDKNGKLDDWIKANFYKS